MNIELVKPAMLALAGAVALASSGGAVAHEPNEVDEWVQYSGMTTLSAGGLDITCRTTISGIIDVSTGNVFIFSVGGSSQDPNFSEQCANIYTGNLEWTATLSNVGSNVSGTVSAILFHITLICRW